MVILLVIIFVIGIGVVLLFINNPKQASSPRARYRLKVSQMRSAQSN
jgi:hypothetical protein